MPDTDSFLNNPVFVCLHYWAGSAREWDQVAAELAPEFKCLAPDLGGFGVAAVPKGGHSIEAYTDSIAALIAEKQLTSFILVGHSMGGKIALNLAARHPAGLRGLVLLSPSPPTPEPMTDEDRTASLRAYGNATAALGTFTHITARPVSTEIRVQIIEDNLRSRREAWDAWLLHGSRENITGHMCDIQVPCTILVGDADAVMSPSVHGLETLPYLPEGTHLEIISGAGHLLPYEAPQEVAALLRKFGRRVETPR
ncbi:alpha/beta fold hydrolase [Hymenobacter cavernae]|uniref:Hydrolase n=1 Tax=Hymenobacter cavernae TaxID=2044852 RepID=A0ABQ1TRG5_9BACT|nr:alpha/beta hydrolase [Hymenobacter cavernae]GGF01266.1 hydrolase [Hymenobacter cavernae]